MIEQKPRVRLSSDMQRGYTLAIGTENAVLRERVVMVSKKPIRNVSEKDIFGREGSEKDLWSTFKVVFKKTGKGIVIIEEDMTFQWPVRNLKNPAATQRSTPRKRRTRMEFVLDDDVHKMKEYHCHK